MTDRQRKTFLTISNIGWVIPIFVAFHYGSVFWSVVPACMFLFSVLYHMTENRLLEILDTISAVLFLLCGPLLLTQAQASIVEWFIALMVTIVAISFYVIARLYRLQDKQLQQVITHCLWHIASACLGTTIYLIYFGRIVL